MADHDPTTGPPAAELADFSEPPDPALRGRVRRSINRRLLAADAVDFGLGAMLAAAWHYVLALIEALNPSSPSTEDPRDEQ